MGLPMGRKQRFTNSILVIVVFRWKWGVVKVGWVVKWHVEIEGRWFWCQNQYKNGFGKWSFLHPGGTPDRGNHLSRWKWGVVKVGWVAKWHLEIESRWFGCKNQYKNGFGKWSFLHPGGTPDRGNHLPRWKWGVVKVGWVAKWHLEIESRWFGCKNQYKNGFGKWSFLHPGGTPDRGNHLVSWGFVTQEGRRDQEEQRLCTNRSLV